ncbi:S-isoprenylcysteine methyltransferase [Litorivita pollutaquae]|uniref:S-isoprenylcysteine methyltransferase n=1 Tax=Litorivita pollutaquae TaxID=2200892 RepID=A0A2V4MPA2_9RHOB|nr:isoprenylcysteine carboxylmethyltransferase family protein [Litorivita pollutaquae]OUS22089.1 S-isoprenylcysteine methyltransferase [Rhodobacterales bacterium 59_46_T64]PYC48561.1 S-isoprenylcysteine methyltransferase [Litorivita pollutaquae]
MKWFDMPPVYLIAALALAWLQARIAPFGLSFGADRGWYWADLLGGLMIGGGVLLLALAVMEMRRKRTTIVPHRDADALVDTGVFSRSRNPIYLGDALILTGAILWMDAVLALVLVPVFVWIIERRFILPEENRLRRKFHTAFVKYTQNTRRWI